MAKSKRKRTPKSVLKLPDLEQSRSAVLNSLTSPSSHRTYDHAIREFIEWYSSEPGIAFNKTDLAPAKRIAAMSGFESYSSFAATFEATRGLSPSQYRAALKPDFRKSPL
jgi:AraC-like DNA-binding protein